jgi:D-alanine-D-alanine ligase
MKINLFVVYGGKSVEHDISLKTALTVLQAIDRLKFDVYPVYINREGVWCCSGMLGQESPQPEDLLAEATTADVAHSLGMLLTNWLTISGPKVVLPLLHGSNGEDGTVQGLLELLNMPYVGNGVLASALTLDKAVAKQVIAQAGIRQAAYVSFTLEQWRTEAAKLLAGTEARLGLPVYVKPASLGSSIGITRCTNKMELRSGIEEAFRYDTKLVIEQEIIGREIQVAVLGNERPHASLPGEFIHRRPFFDFESKYMDKELTMSIPAQLADEITMRIRQSAIDAYEALGCAGLARVDFFVDEHDEIYLNEVNALPGFTNFSMYPVMWERTNGTSYSELIEKLIDYAIQRHETKQAICYMR